MKEYTVKDLLLSTKDKLAELEGKLRKLSEMTVHNQNAKSVRYGVYYEGYKQPELYYYVIWNDKNLKGIIKNLLMHSGWSSIGRRESDIVYKNNNGYPYIKSRTYQIHIPYGSNEHFKIIAGEVLNDEFVHEFLKDHIIYHNGGYIDLGTSWIDTHNTFKDQYYNKHFIYYTANNKAIYNGNELSDELLMELLNAKLNPDNLSDYRRKMIDESSVKNKEIIIPKFYDKTGKIEFNIEEDEKTLCLIKK